MTDWLQWYAQYDDPQSTLSQRLAAVQAQIRDVVEAATPGPVRVLSLCAGDGRDLIGALHGHPRRDDVRGLLVEFDPVLAARGSSLAWPGLRYTVADAGVIDNFVDAAPADLILVCGVFGNISADDIHTTIDALPSLLAPAGTVIWTRSRVWSLHPELPDLVPAIDGWFRDAGFERTWLSGPEHRYGVGVHRLVAPPRAVVPGQRLFTFIR